MSKMKFYIYCFLLLNTFLIGCSKKNDEKTILEKRKNHQSFLARNRTRAQIVLKKDFNFYGIEIIYVQPGESYYQWFGHSLIRFVGSGKSPLEDITISFIADFNDDELDPIKAYYGGYEVLPVIKKWSGTIQEYIVTENRYIDRFIFLSTESQRNIILEELRDWIKDPKVPGTYSFRRNGCTALLLKLLAKATKVDGEKVVFPVEVVPYLKKIGLISWQYRRLNQRSNTLKLSSVISKKSYQRIKND